MHPRFGSGELLSTFADRTSYSRSLPVPPPRELENFSFCSNFYFSCLSLILTATVKKKLAIYIQGCFVTCGKKSHKYMSYLSSFMRYNEFSVLITFTKDAQNDHFAFENKPARVLSLIWLLTLSFLVFLEFVGRLALFYFVVFQHVQSMLRIQ